MNIYSRVSGDITRGDGFVELFIASGLSHSEPVQKYVLSCEDHPAAKSLWTVLSMLDEPQVDGMLCSQRKLPLSFIHRSSLSVESLFGIGACPVAYVYTSTGHYKNTSMPIDHGKPSPEI